MVCSPLPILALAVVVTILITGIPGHAAIDESADDASSQFNLWSMADPHVFSDLFLRRHELRRLNPEGDLLPHESGRIPRVDARESLGSAIIQSESDEGFGWDIAICAGDFSGSISQMSLATTLIFNRTATATIRSP